MATRIISLLELQTDRMGASEAKRSLRVGVRTFDYSGLGGNVSTAWLGIKANTLTGAQ